MFGASGLYQWHNATATSDTGLTLLADQSINQPSEVIPDDDTGYDVPPTHPRRIILPTLQVSGFVQQVGVNQDNEVGVPANIHVGGWYNRSVLPGQPGLSVIDGHVSGRYRDGIFKQLEQLIPGDTFTIEFGDYSTKTFEVVAKRTEAAETAVDYLFEQQDGIDAQLNLITCGGEFDAAADQYPDRVIVSSKLL